MCSFSLCLCFICCSWIVAILPVPVPISLSLSLCPLSLFILSMFCSALRMRYRVFAGGAKEMWHRCGNVAERAGTQAKGMQVEHIILCDVQKSADSSVVAVLVVGCWSVHLEDQPRTRMGLI